MSKLQMRKITNDGLTRSGMHRMLYICTNMATVGVKELTLKPPKVAVTPLSHKSGPVLLFKAHLVYPQWHHIFP